MQVKEEHIPSITLDTIDFQSIATTRDLKQYVLAGGAKIISEALITGAKLYEQVAEMDKLVKNDPLESNLLQSHIIGQQSKRIALLYRDILFEIQKAELLVMEGAVSEDQLSDLVHKSKIALTQANDVYDNTLSDEGMRSWDASLLVKQDHPWPIYQAQLTEIQGHLIALSDNEAILTNLSAKVKTVKETIAARLSEIKQRFDDLQSQAENILRSTDHTDIGIVIDLLNSTNQSLDQSGMITEAHSLIEKAIMDAPINIVPKVNIQGGVLIEEDLSPQYQLEQWYEVEILPLIEDAYQQIDTMTYNFRLSLINIINRLELLHNKATEFNFEDHLQPLHRFMDSVPSFREAIDLSVNEISEKINANLSLHPLLSEGAPFLSMGFQGSINRFKKEQNLLLERLGYFWGMLKDKYFSIKSTVQEESKLGDVVKVIRYIQGASSDRKNVHYNNFFNAKVTMVEAFWMGRDIEQKRIAQVIQSWNDGYHGAILFYGDRYAGKSSLGDWMSQQYFRGKTYELQPGQSIMISNTKVDLTDDLIESIRSFIDRVQYAKPMIWIDDLELWFDDEHLSNEVTASLAALINEYGKKVFFAVSIGSWMYQRLNRFIDLDHTFQSTIEMSPFTKEVLKEAILLRHGASHKTLIGSDGQELSKIEFDRYITKIARQSEGNIGHALQLWVNSIEYKDDQHVEIGEALKYKFPDIITSDNGIVLSSLLIYRKMSEQDLKNLLGPSYEERYEGEITRLIGYGVIRKSYNGLLSINDKVVPAVTEALRKNRFI